MLKILKSSVAIAALAGVGVMSPVMAQSASEMTVRVQMLEEQVRSLTGKVQELSYEVNQLKAQNGQKSGEAAPLDAPAAQPALRKQFADAMPAAEDDIATIDAQPLEPMMNADPAVGANELPDPNNAPGPQVLGSLGTSAAEPNDGGFQGKVLVPPSQQEPGDDAFFQQDMMSDSPQDNSIETVSLSPDTPESLYEQSNENLLRRQFADAEAGFSTFLTKYPDHGLAGSAQYWLGETYYAQRDYKRAAQNFLHGYKTYPKSRRAADSLLKLGISLGRLGQSQQACAAYAAVSAEYPKAVEARRRAQAEARRAGCAS